MPSPVILTQLIWAGLHGDFSHPCPHLYLIYSHVCEQINMLSDLKKKGHILDIHYVDY